MNNRGALAMGTANAVALVMAAGGYFVYSRLLDPGQFAIYAGALAIAKLGQMLIDGGLKVALIQQGANLSPGARRGAFLACSCLALSWTAILACILWVAVTLGRITDGTATFLFLYPAAYFTLYPLLVISLADLERGLEFTPIAWAEGSTFSIEYAIPALLWTTIHSGMWTFVASVWIARAARVAILSAANNRLGWFAASPRPDWMPVRQILGVGFKYQLACVSSMVRDNLHFLLIAPLFGRNAAGMYAWVLQLCAVASQVFVQTVSRVSYPAMLMVGDDDARWRQALDLIFWLSILTFPPLLCLQYLAPAVNGAFFHDKWTPALALLPYVLWRMLPGLATTPLGSLVLAQEGTKRYAFVNGLWSAAEILAAILCIAFAGVKGLALSYSFMAWLGVLLCTAGSRGATGIVDVLGTLLLRPSVWVATIMTLPLGIVPASFKANIGKAAVYSIVVCVASVASEPAAWKILRGKLAGYTAY